MVLTHALGYLVAAMLQAASALGLVAALTRLLSDVGFGQYALATASLHLYQSVVFFWLRANVSRFHAGAQHDGTLDSFLGSVRRWFLLAMFAGTLVAGPVLLVLPISPGLRVCLVATLGVAAVQGAFTLVLELHRATLRAWHYALFQSAQAVLSVGLSVAAVLLAGHYAGSYGASVAMAGLALSYAACLLIDMHGIRFWRLSAGPALPGALRGMLAYGLPLSLAMVVDAVFATGDRFVIARFFGEAAVGPYAAGVTLAHRSLLAICTVVGAAAAPLAFAALAQGGTQEAQRRMADAGDLLLAIAVPAALGLTALAGPISQVMVAETMREEVATLLPWIAAGALLHGLAAHYFDQAFLVANRPMTLVWLMLPVLVLYGVLNLVLVQRYGAFGAALAMVGTQAVHVVLVAAVGRRFFAMPLRWVTALKTLVAGAAMTAVLHAVPLPAGLAGLLAQVALGGAAYGVGALVLDIAGCRSRALRRLFA